MNLSKENTVSYLLNETARCGLSDSDTSLRDVAIDYFMHDSFSVSNEVFLALNLVLVLPSSG